MQIFSPLFARGRGTVEFFKGLVNGDPVAWGILGVIVLGFAVYGIYQYSKSQQSSTLSDVTDVKNPGSAEKVCPRCGARVKPLADGKCPACWEHKF